MDMDLILSAEKFIAEYRKVESATPRVGEELIKAVVKDKGTAAHLCRSWRGRKRDWGDFYLNLSRDVQYGFLKAWGLGRPEGEAYIKEMKANPIAMLWADAPTCIEWPHTLLKFFYNHGISVKPAVGIVLPKLPSEKKCFGNSTNWGNYILSLSDEERKNVLRQIANSTLVPKPEKSKQRGMNR
ncbi:hypothetical protein [Olivibacter jilunii]|uniref:hypothetical protein n=1 Tax=Olivibacter jilunii TaxID=985016 RepID=UPI0010309BCD|nr:hypothetical protein [Olivibacter jilunii]